MGTQALERAARRKRVRADAAPASAAFFAVYGEWAVDRCLARRTLVEYPTVKKIPCTTNPS